ncbi:DNA damage-regulated autophagy modulator protein 2-like isoform X1 [Ptychodera flava]|uniref:DNA damage-regulated autophagy modulator protein 2-like isoform X1 n=1 Tax=Ptychodera flava TaxID=63121 RepID=UPI00396A73C9
MCKSWFCVGMGWLPMSVAIMVAATFTISYCISVGLGHVPAEFPYISDTGTYIPESCIFGQLLNITAALAFATIYVRYKQVQEYNREASPAILRANKIALVIGGFACLGMSMVANFQETNELQVHVFAANLCFGPGVVYCYMQTWLSYKMAPFHATIFACRARILLCFFATLGFVFTSVFAALANTKWHGDDQTKWKPEDGGFTEHIFSTAFEWVLAISFLSYFFTFVREFQKITMETTLRMYTEELEPINHPEI